MTDDNELPKDSLSDRDKEMMEVAPNDDSAKSEQLAVVKKTGHNEIAKGLFELTERTTEQEFFEMINAGLPSDIKESLGPDAGKKVGEAIMYLVPFAPPPVTFDRAAITFVAQLDSQDVEPVIKALKYMGVLEEQKSGRLMIKPNDALVEFVQKFMQDEKQPENSLPDKREKFFPGNDKKLIGQGEGE